MQIELQEGVTAFSIHRPRPIPVAQRDQVKEALEKMVRDGVITPVSGPTDWAHPMIVAEKANGDPRICVDLTRLNWYVKRPIYPVRTPKDAVSSISGTAKWFTTVSKTLEQTGMIVSMGKNRDYRVKKPSGRVLWRNRRFLRPDHTLLPESEDQTTEKPREQEQARKRGRPKGKKN